MVSEALLLGKDNSRGQLEFKEIVIEECQIRYTCFGIFCWENVLDKGICADCVIVQKAIFILDHFRVEFDTG